MFGDTPEEKVQFSKALKEKVHHNTDQFKENMPKEEHNALGEEKRDSWKKKFSRIIGIFHSGSTYHRDKAGPKRVMCSVVNNATGRVMIKADGQRFGKWGAEGNAKRNALRALKKTLGKRF